MSKVMKKALKTAEDYRLELVRVKFAMLDHLEVIVNDSNTTRREKHYEKMFKLITSIKT